MHYRKEIDGLRAIAILPVIFCHAGFNFFSGGFVGVDIFFVISGYLITLLILEEKSQGTFTLTGFYERRVRRILPALFFVTLICIPIAWLRMGPLELKYFSESVVSVALFSANFLFWIKSDFFITALDLQPLIHTWSLAIEEQFYLLYPLLLLALWPLGKKWSFVILFCMGLLSLGFSEWGSHHAPMANFYLLPTRSWELIIGAVCAFYLLNNPKAPPKIIADILCILALLLIWACVSGFDRGLTYPDLYTLYPTLSTACIILFVTPNTWIGKFLSNSFVSGIGLISYSAYLLHQPLFVFARLYSEKTPSPWIFLLLSFGTLFLAFLSWKYIEQPFRKPVPNSKQRPFKIAVIGSLIVISMGCLGFI